MDAAGDPVLFAEDILSIKSFDTKGNRHSNNNRLYYGSNYYFGSNVRQWLNSSEPSIPWTQNRPSWENTMNPYETEKGFLAEGNFSAAERSLLKPFTHKVILPQADAALRDGGTTPGQWSGDRVLNEETTAYYKQVTELVFLLSASQLRTYVADRGWSITAKPTTGAINNSSYDSNPLLISQAYWLSADYWLNTPVPNLEHTQTTVNILGGVGSDFALKPTNGVRPALQLKRSATVFAAGGAGTVSQPFVVTGSTTVLPPDANTTDKIAPTAPTDLFAADVAVDRVALKWTAATDNVGVTAYEVYRGTTLLDGNVTGTSFEVTGLKANTAYSFTVRAKDAAGNRSAAAGELRVSTLRTEVSDLLAPSVPSGFTVSRQTATGFMISWKASVDTGGSGLDGYEVYLGDGSDDGGGGIGTVPLATVTKPSYLFTGLAPSGTYNVRVLAYDKAGNKSSLSSIYVVTTLTDTVAPFAPAGLTHEVIEPTSFRLKWLPSNDNVAVTGYEVFRDGVSVGKTSETFIDVTGLREQVTYNMTVRAYDAASRVSAVSAVYRAQTYLDRTAPSVPAGLGASDVSSKRFTVSWEPATDDRVVAGYQVFLRVGESVPMLIGTTVDETFEVTVLTPGATYDVWIKAFDAAGPQPNVSAASEVLEVTTVTDAGAPTIPDDLQAHTILGTSFVLAWEASMDDVGVDFYEIYKNGVLFRTNYKSLSLIIDELAVNTTYSMTVKAVDKSGTASDASEPLMVTTTDSTQPGPALSIVKLTRIADKSAVLRYALGSDATIVVRVLNSANRSVATIVNHVRIRGGLRTAMFPTKAIKGGKYYVQLIARDPVSGKRSIVYKNMTIDHTAPVVSSVMASAINASGASSNVTFTLSEKAYVTVIAHNGKLPVRTIAQRVLMKSGANTVQWNGRDRRNRLLADGTYRIEVFASDFVGLESKKRSVSLRIERALSVVSGVVATSTPFKATGARSSICTIRFQLSERANVTVKIWNEATEVATLLNNVSRSPGASSVTWDGRNTARESRVPSIQVTLDSMRKNSATIWRNINSICRLRD